MNYFMNNLVNELLHEGMYIYVDDYYMNNLLMDYYMICIC